MERVELFKILPFRYRVLWWTITIFTLTVMAPLLVVALLNPLWFRDDFFRWAEAQLYRMSGWRDDFMEPHVKKYRLFATIKDS